MECLQHHGIKGQKWGVRRFQNKDGTLTDAGKIRYAIDNKKSIITNADGSKSVPKGFIFNRVGKTSLDINESGAIFVSYGNDDVNRYIKILGPTNLNKLFGISGEAVQRIRVKKTLNMPSDEETATEITKLLLDNKKLRQNLNESIYRLAITGDFKKKVLEDDLKKALSSSSRNEIQRIAYGTSSFLGDGYFADEAQIVYAHFRNKGYDAIPDIHDRLSGVSKTAMIIINPDKIEVDSATVITKDVMKSAKKYVRNLEKLKVNDLIT